MSVLVIAPGSCALLMTFVIVVVAVACHYDTREHRRRAHLAAQRDQGELDRFNADLHEWLTNGSPAPERPARSRARRRR